MNPTSPTKPVMDVAAPKSSAAAPAHGFSPAPAAQPSLSTAPAQMQPAPQSVRPAPFSSPASAALAPTPAVPISKEQPLHKQPAGAPAMAQHRAPAALITVTVFVMLVLSALAVTVYVTSRTA